MPHFCGKLFPLWAEFNSKHINLIICQKSCFLVFYWCSRCGGFLLLNQLLKQKLPAKEKTFSFSNSLSPSALLSTSTVSASSSFFSFRNRLKICSKYFGTGKWCIVVGCREKKSGLECAKSRRERQPYEGSK